MKAVITKTFGQFSFDIAGDFPGVEAAKGSLTAEAIERAFLAEVERGPSSRVENAVFGPMLGWELNRNGNYKRPEKFERGSVDYTDEVARKLAEYFGKQTAEFGTHKLPLTVVSYSRHEIGETADSRKQAETRVADMLSKGTVAQFIEWWNASPFHAQKLAANADRTALVEAMHKQYFARK